jgi:hypothetical protein
MLRRILNLAPATLAGGTGSPPAAPAPTGSTAASPPPAAGQPPASAPALPTSDNPPDDKADIFSELDASFTTKVAKPAEPAKPTAAAEPPQKPDATPAAPAAPAAQEPKNIKELRDWGKRYESENKTLKTQLADLETRRTEWEAKGRDTEKLSQRITELESHIADRDKRIYALNVSESPDFKEKFVKPFDDNVRYAAEIVAGLEVPTATDPDTGEVTAVRKADFNNDFVPIYQMASKNLTEARKMAKATFGEDAQTVLNHVQELQRLDRARNVKLKELQDSAKDEQAKEHAHQQQEKDFIAKAWRDYNADIAEKNPEYFQPDPKDKERAEIWNKAIGLVDSRHNNKALTLPQQILADAQIRHRAAGYAVVRYDLTKARERIAELEGEIAQYKNGGPGATKNPGGEPTGNQAEKSFIEELTGLEA